MNRKRDSILEVKELSLKVAGKNILRDISFKISRPELVALVGGNGAGKTSLLRSITGVFGYDGEVRLCEGSIARMSTVEIASRVSYVPQGLQAPVGYTVGDFLSLGEYARINVSSDFEAGLRFNRVTDRVLSDLGLNDLIDTHVSCLSQGQFQRVLLASSLVQDTELILIDEPTAYLDPGYCAEVFPLLRKFVDDYECCIIFATHELNLAAAYCDRALGLKLGCLCYDGDTPNLMTGFVLKELYGTEFLLHKVEPYSFSLIVP